MSALHAPEIQSPMHQLNKRGNWARHEAGVIVVFCIVFVVAMGLLSLAIRNLLAKRRVKTASRSEV
jgi:hypothetical protein